jgi:transposase
VSPDKPLNLFRERLFMTSQPAPIHIGCEATGTYHLALRDAVIKAGHPLYLIDGYQLSRYRGATSVRAKTDPIDARLTAAALCATFHRGAFTRADAFIAYLGLDVCVRQSGNQHARGFSCTQALVALARKIARVAFSLMKTGTQYQPGGLKNTCAQTWTLSQPLRR